MVRSGVRLVTIFALVLAVAACSQPPQQELESAREAISAADAAGAPEYAAEAWAEARQKLDEAEAEISRQNEKFSLFRSYGSAKEQLAAAADAAGSATAAADEAKQKARGEAQAARDAAMEAVARAEGLIAELEACRRRPKGFAQDMELMKGNLDGLKAEAGGVEEALTSEDFIAAKSRAEALLTEAEALATDLENAKSKLGC